MRSEVRAASFLDDVLIFLFLAVTPIVVIYEMRPPMTFEGVVSYVVPVISACLCAWIVSRCLGVYTRDLVPANANPAIVIGLLVCSIMITAFLIASPQAPLVYLPIAPLVVLALLDRDQLTRFAGNELKFIPYLLTMIFVALVGGVSGTAILVGLTIYLLIVIKHALERALLISVLPFIAISGYFYWTELPEIIESQMMILQIEPIASSLKTFAYFMGFTFLEEALGRGTIPFVGSGLPTYLFLSLHIPSKAMTAFSYDMIMSPWATAHLVMITFAVLGFNTYLLVRCYMECGLIGSWLAHAIYNTYLTLVALGRSYEAVVLLILLTILQYLRR